MNNLIFETLLAEAQFRLAEKTITGITLDEAIYEVTNELHLDRKEVTELQERAKKAPSVRPVQEDDDGVNMDDLMGGLGDDDDSDADPAGDVPTSDNTIAFDSDDELETAMGVLMYKGIPWVSRAVTSLTFMTPDHVREAHEALKRRWDFVNHDERTVAIIEFDNIEDYQKVLDFVATKNMTVLLGSNDELNSDMDQELAEAEADHKVARKLAKEAGQPAPEAPVQNMSYRALHKDKLTDVKSLDPATDNQSRCVRIVKRWK